MSVFGHRAEKFLDEQGITITRTHIAAGGKTYEFANLKGGQIERTRLGLLATILKKPPTFRLIITEGTGAIPLCVFETLDAAFAARISDAMGKAAKANSGQRLR
jgi:hypothetical protein